MSSNTAFYRKYRPNSFFEVEGQEFIVKTLKNSIINNKISHAYIFSGSRGIGKTSIAKIFAKSINCLNPKNGDCCNECKNCISIYTNTTMDIIEMDAASNNGVNDIRNIVDNIGYLPSSLKYKVYIIDEAHMLTNGAWNALLKTIEEPPKHLIFIFATTEPHKFPLTIISRCQKFTLSNLSIYDLKNTIQSIVKKENIKIEDEAITKIASISDGSARDCLTYLGQLDAFTNSNITVNDVNNVFGLLDTEQKLMLIKNIVNCKFEKLIQSINEFEIMGIDFYQLGIQIIEIFFDKLIYEKTKNDNLLKVLTKLNINFENIQPKFLIKLIDIWQDGLYKMKINSNQKFFFELTCLSGTKVFDFDNSPNNLSQKSNIQNDDYIKRIEENIVVKKEIHNTNDESDDKNIKNNSNSNKKDNNFKNVSFDLISTKKIYGKNNSIKNIEITEIKNKIENKNLKILSEKVFESEDINKSIFEPINEFAKDINIDEIIKKSIVTKPFIINNKKKEKEINEVNELNDVNKNFEENLFTIFNNSESKYNYNINNTNIKEETNKKEISKKEEIINDFKTKLKTVAIPISKEIKQKNDNSKVENLEKEISKKDEKINNDILEKKDIDSLIINDYSEDDKFNIFLSIAANNDNNQKVRVCNEFNKIKNKIARCLEEGYLVGADRILVVSKNGVVILFNDEIGCRNLNLNSSNISFLKYINQKFGKVYLFLAITIDEAKIFKEKFKEINTEVNDVNIDELLDKINKKETIKDLAFDMLSDLIEEEE